jgi:hypothetical protein
LEERNIHTATEELGSCASAPEHHSSTGSIAILDTEAAIAMGEPFHIPDLVEQSFATIELVAAITAINPLIFPYLQRCEPKQGRFG